jgi:glycosyltransferase involved in cell wall biosynthesis
MASGCCIVATPTSGVTEQIRHRHSGYIAYRISGPSLGEALREAMDDPNGRAHCAENARRRVEEEFSEATMVARYLELYQSLQR